MSAEAIRPEALRTLREENGITQRELAKALGVDYTLMSRWEAGDRKPPTEQTVWKAVQAILKKRAALSEDRLQRFESDRR